MVTRVLRSIEVKWDGSNVRLVEATVEIGDDTEGTQVLVRRTFPGAGVTGIADNLITAIVAAYSAIQRPVTLPGA